MMLGGNTIFVSRRRRRSKFRTRVSRFRYLALVSGCCESRNGMERNAEMKWKQSSLASAILNK